MTGPTFGDLPPRAAALTRWAMVDDRTAATAPGREAAWLRYERLVDPDSRLRPEERRRRALLLRRAEMIVLSEKAVAARRAKRGGR